MSEEEPAKPTLYWHPEGCPCEGCEQARLTRAQRSTGRVYEAGDVALRFVLWAIGLIVLLFVLRWGYTEYWISQHCTMILGTRVCQ